MDSEPSESGVSMQTSNRRMSNNMSEPLSGMPDGITPNAQVTNDCLPAGQRPNKTPIFISVVTDTRAFLARLWTSCPGANALATRSATADTHLRVSLVGASTSPLDALPRGGSLCAVAAGEITQRTTVVV